MDCAVFSAAVLGMKTPLCEVDAQREILCNECKKRLDEGSLSDLDIAISRILGRMDKSFPISSVEFKQAIDLNEMIVMVCEGNIGTLIGKKGRIVSEITRKVGKKVRVIEHTKDEKKMIQDLVGGARVLGVNKIFKPKKQEYKVIISRFDEGKLMISKENLEKGIQQLLQAETSVEFR